MINSYRNPKEPNIFIGNESGSYVIDRNWIVGRTSLFPHEISNIVIDVNGNVSFYASVKFTFTIDLAFNQVDYFEDKTGKFLGGGGSGVKQVFNGSNVKSLLLNGFDGNNGSSNRNARYTTLFSASNWNIIQGQSLRDNPNFKWGYFRNVTTINGASAFRLSSAILRIYLPIAENYYNGGGNTNEIFYDIKTGCKIYVKPSELTINAGNPSPALKWAVDNRGAILIGVLNFTSPGDVLDLSASAILTTSCVLSFTPPSSVNTLDFYEVWIERQDLTLYKVERVIERNSIKQEISGTGGVLSGLVSGRTYKIKIVACDIYWNRSNFSNEITITTL